MYNLYKQGCTKEWSRIITSSPKLDALTTVVEGTSSEASQVRVKVTTAASEKIEKDDSYPVPVLVYRLWYQKRRKQKLKVRT